MSNLADENFRAERKRKDDKKMWKCKGQMSESIWVGILLSITGGFQDAYTYFCRDHVFANGQTGNMVLMGEKLATGKWAGALRYFIPVLAFATGIYTAEKIRHKYQWSKKIHWRQIVVIIEAILLFLVGWIPQTYNLCANIIVSFVCALQIESFRKVLGNSYASTMCIGNLRIATEALCNYRATGNKVLRKKSITYYTFIIIFIIGAATGGILTAQFGDKAIWICSILLICSFLVMFINENE